MAGEYTIFEADQENQFELQALGRMQGHQLHAVFPGFALAFAGFERGV